MTGKDRTEEIIRTLEEIAVVSDRMARNLRLLEASIRVEKRRKQLRSR